MYNRSYLKSRAQAHQGLHIPAVVTQDVIPCQQREVIFIHSQLVEVKQMPKSFKNAHTNDYNSHLGFMFR